MEGMITQLKKLLSKKGFSLLELIVVLAIVGVLSAMIFATMSDKSGKIANANAHAKDIFLVTQNLMTSYELAEDQLVKYGLTETKFIKYDATKHVNSIDNGEFLFIEVACVGDKVTTVRIAGTLSELCREDKCITIVGNSTLETKMRDDFTARVSNVNNGYYYVLVDSGFKVIATHYTEFPYRYTVKNDLIFTSEGISNGVVTGTCINRNYTLDFSALAYSEVGYKGGYFFDTKSDNSGNITAFNYICQ